MLVRVMSCAGLTQMQWAANMNLSTLCYCTQMLVRVMSCAGLTQMQWVARVCDISEERTVMCCGRELGRLMHRDLLFSYCFHTAFT